MKKIILSTVCAGVLAIPAMADVFDDNKQGFIFGLGIGATSVSTDVNFQNGINIDEREFGVATSLKLGYGFNEQFLLYYTNQVDWYDFQGDSTIVGLTGVGIDYYFDNNSPFYSTTMIGIGSISDIKDNSSSRGFAYELGFGYDIAPHMSIEASYMNIDIEDHGNIDTDSFRVKFNYTWY